MLKQIKQLCHIGIFLTMFIVVAHINVHQANAQETFFQIQSIDTMKISRDVAREKKNDAKFNDYITTVTRQIAKTGATHIAIATPYDEEFLPFLEKWVQSARTYHLKIWFRGNFSGWEEWFDYPRINREEHLKKTASFILDNPQLFQNGDLFSSCPECENGGPGDPREIGDVEGYREFLINEYTTSKNAFTKIGKNVQSNLFSMNGDVANLIMDKPTTHALDDIVVIDHYVKSPEQTIKDIDKLAEQSGGKIILGEVGVPIPDIHGDMTEAEQATWIEKLLSLLVHNSSIIGLNYWTSHNSSTEMWRTDNTPKKAASVLQKYYTPHYVKGTLIDQFGKPVVGAKIKGGTFVTSSNDQGAFTLLYLDDVGNTISAEKEGYVKEKIALHSDQPVLQLITLKHRNPSFFSMLFKFLRSLLHK